MADPSECMSPGLAVAGRCAHWVMMRFARHEAWAIRTAMKAPLFSTHVSATLWIWTFPVIPASLPLVLLSGHALIPAAILGMVASILFLAAAAPWFFRWGFICMGLMAGRRELAQKKQKAVLARLDRLRAMDPRQAIHELRVFPKRGNRDAAAGK
ncbi:hypothetical protein [Poseidonocella sp. HB161398]|uniref:hypothetical protein n=1 Tax=Poseidonocella sp. HB161398 TaxID=2320855 RepID=UPI001109FD3A|nr:hypothetical protein [Poseidonocella sp. HB161398]